MTLFTWNNTLLMVLGCFTQQFSECEPHIDINIVSSRIIYADTGKKTAPPTAKFYDWRGKDRGGAIRNAVAASIKQNMLIVLLMSDNQEHIAKVKKVVNLVASTGRERIAIVRITKSTPKSTNMITLMTDGKLQSVITGSGGAMIFTAAIEFYDRDIEKTSE